MKLVMSLRIPTVVPSSLLLKADSSQATTTTPISSPLIRECSLAGGVDLIVDREMRQRPVDNQTVFECKVNFKPP